MKKIIIVTSYYTRSFGSYESVEIDAVSAKIYHSLGGKKLTPGKDRLPARDDPIWIETIEKIQEHYFLLQDFWVDFDVIYNHTDLFRQPIKGNVKKEDLQKFVEDWKDVKAEFPELTGGDFLYDFLSCCSSPFQEIFLDTCYSIEEYDDENFKPVIRERVRNNDGFDDGDDDYPAEEILELKPIVDVDKLMSLKTKTKVKKYLDSLGIETK